MQLRAEIFSTANGGSLESSELELVEKVEKCLVELRDALRQAQEPGCNEEVPMKSTEKALADQSMLELCALRQRRQLASIAFDQSASLARAALRRPLS